MPKGGFEPPRGLPTTPSRWRVYQFHHFGIRFANEKKSSAVAALQFKREYRSKDKRPTLLYFFGSGAGTWGCTGISEGAIGADGTGLSLIIVEALFVEEKVRRSEVIIKMTAATVVSLERNPIAPALPKMV